MAQTPKSIRVKVQVDAEPEVLLRALRLTWTAEDIIVAVLSTVPTEELAPLLRRAVTQDGRLVDVHTVGILELPYADEPLRPEYPPRAGQRSLNLLEDVPPERARLIWLLILLTLLAEIALLLVT